MPHKSKVPQARARLAAAQIVLIFVVQVRAIFSAEFQKHKELFPGTDGEASESKWANNSFET